MVEGLRTCLSCETRVLPTAGDMCPACRRYKFTGAAGETAPPGSDPARRLAAARDMYYGAVLHWRLMGLFGGLVVLIFSGLGMALVGRDALGEMGVNVNLAKRAITLGASILSVSMWATARGLTEWLRLVDPRSGEVRSINIPSLLKHSMTYFEVSNVPVGVLGPRLSAMRPDEEEADEC